MHLLRNGAIAVVALGAVYIGGVAMTSSEFSSNLSNLGLTLKQNSQMTMDLSDYTVSIVEKSSGIFDASHQIIVVSKDGQQSFVLPIETSFGFLNANTKITQLPAKTLENLAPIFNKYGIDVNNIDLTGSVKTKVLPFAYNVKLVGNVKEGEVSDSNRLNTSFKFVITASQNTKEKVVLNADLSNIKVKEHYLELKDEQNKDAVVAVTTVDKLALNFDRPIFEYRKDLGDVKFSIDGIKMSSGLLFDEEATIGQLTGTVRSTPITSENTTKLYLTLNGSKVFEDINTFDLKLSAGMFDLSGLFADADGSDTRKEALVADNLDSKITVNLEKFSANFKSQEPYTDTTNKYRPKELLRDADANLTATGKLTFSLGESVLTGKDSSVNIVLTTDKAGAYKLSDFTDFVETKGNKFQSNITFDGNELKINGKTM